MRVYFSLAILIPLYSCQNDSTTEELIPEKEEAYNFVIPEGFPTPEFPSDYEITSSKVELGKKLFFDPALSKDSTVSCSSCHHPQYAFSDTVRFSIGVNDSLGQRNAPPLFNLLWHESFMRDGGVPTVARQVLSPLQDEREMHSAMEEVIHRLNRSPVYQPLFEEAFGDTVNAFTLTRALEAFELTLISANSPFDRYYYRKEEYAISSSAKRGWELFQSSKLNCVSCHSGPNFTNEKYECNGLYLEYQDEARARITHEDADFGRFKVPSLRNLVFTAPYFHDGSARTLDEVINHYQKGGAEHPNQSNLVKGFELKEQEREDLKAFLISLSDSTFVNDATFRP